MLSCLEVLNDRNDRATGLRSKKSEMEGMRIRDVVLPASIRFVGKAGDDAQSLSFACGFEQATN